MRKQHLMILAILAISLSAAFLLWSTAQDNTPTVPAPDLFEEPEEEKLEPTRPEPAAVPGIAHAITQTSPSENEPEDESEIAEINFDLPDTITDFWKFARNHPQLLEQLEDCELTPGPIKEALDNTERSFKAMGEDLNFVNGGSPTSDYHSYDSQTLEQLAVNGDRRAISLQAHQLKKAGEHNKARDQFYRAALYGDMAALSQLQHIYRQGALDVKKDKEKTEVQKEQQEKQMHIEAQAWQIVQHESLGLFAYGDPSDNSVIGSALDDEIYAAALVRAEQLQEGLNVQRSRQNIPNPPKPPREIKTDQLLDSIVCP